ncbi:MAG: TlpA family protein disulfide reductase [Flavisolibacter sp.]|nr:TlpA family protein disulfide reductase [Flavisolibacter sp.]
MAGTIPADSFQTAYAENLGLDTFIIARYLHRPWEYYYRRWKEGKSDSAAYVSSLRSFGIETPLPADLPSLDAESLFLLGRRTTGEYIVIADENNNNTLRDDSIRVVSNFRQGKTTGALSSLSAVRINNLQAFYHGQVLTFSKEFRLKPTIILDTAVGKPKETAFHLEIVSTAYATGKFAYKGKRYKVGVRNIHEPLLPEDSKHAIVKFASKKDDSAFQRQWNARPTYRYRTSDTVVLGKAVFAIKDLSPLLKAMTLQPLRMSPAEVQPKGADSYFEAMRQRSAAWVGRPYPDFTIANATTSLTKESLKGKVLFIDFWFEACAPCVAEFEALSQMDDRLRNENDFAFVSLTFESPEVIQRIRQKYGLTFPIYSVSEQECRGLNLGNGYPTNIIVDKGGIIKYVHVGGETSKQEAKTFIDEVIYTKIQKEL